LQGPLGAYEVGKYALASTVSLAGDGGEVAVWGDGEQTRSMLYIDDCVEDIHRLLWLEFLGPLGVGTDRLVKKNDDVDIIGDVAGMIIQKGHDLSKQQGAGGNCDNSQLCKIMQWGPTVPLGHALRATFK